MAINLEDSALLAKIGGGDLMAVEAEYHRACLTKFRENDRAQNREYLALSKEEKKIEARVVIELCSYIENSVEEGILCFKLSELRNLYQSRLSNFGIIKEINKVRFKEAILSHFPDAQAQNDGKHILLILKLGMQHMLKETIHQQEKKMMLLSKAAKIIREEMFNFQGFKFCSSFPSGCQYQASIWTTSELPQQNRPSPASWVWSLDEAANTCTLPVASKACLELIKCSCKSSKGCDVRCGCKKANWNCTELCNCIP